MFTEPTRDDGYLWVALEHLEHRGRPRRERKGALIDQQRVLFVHMDKRQTKPDSILCKYTKCFVIRVVGLDSLPQKAGQGYE